jgi:hypothetical protein
MRFPTDDPLAIAIAPPRNEPPEDRETRERAELEARRVSDAIDDQIRQERSAMKKKKKPVKVLLLGQSESGAFFATSFRGLTGRGDAGKSATLKSAFRYRMIR